MSTNKNTRGNNAAGQGEESRPDCCEKKSGDDRPRRKASVPHRFSVDYYGFPRIAEDSDESDRSTSAPYTKFSASSYFKNIFIMEGDEVRGNRALQYLATLAANMGAFAFGTALSYPAVALPSLREDVMFKNFMTEQEESWVGAVFALGAVVSGPAAGYAIEKIGRRMSMMVLSVPFFLSWMLINIATDMPMIIGGRFLTGFFSGIFLVAAPIFTAEIADVSIRGAVGATFDMSSSVGILFIYIVGTYCSWRTQAFICAIIPILIFLLMLLIPESPAYLLGKGRPEQAKEALIRYKGAKSNPDNILALLDDLQQEVVDSRTSEKTSFRDLLARPILIPVSIAFMVFVFQVICGLDPILVYTVDIFKSASGPGGRAAAIDEYTSTIIFGVIELVAGILAAFFVDKTGRRFLLLLSEVVMVLSLMTLGLFFYLRAGVQPASDVPPSAAVIQSSLLNWLPLISLSIYILAYSLGLGPVGYLLMGEILPLRVKGLAGCLLTSAKWLLSFFVTKFFSEIVLLIGEAGCFWLFAVFCAFGGVFILLFVPETNGRSLEDIQRTFRRRYSVDNLLAPNISRVGEAEPLIRGGNTDSASQYRAINTGNGDKATNTGYQAGPPV